MVVFKEPFETPDVAEAGDLSFALDLTHHAQAAHDQRVAVGDGDGGLGLAGVEDRVHEREYELAVLAKVVDEYMKKATPEEREEIQELLQKAKNKAKHPKRYAAVSGTSVLSVILNTLGKKAAKEVLKTVLKKILAKQGVKQGSKLAGRFAGLAIPFLNIVMGVWLAIDIAGPAYRKTVPAVIQIALLRMDYE